MIRAPVHTDEHGHRPRNQRVAEPRSPADEERRRSGVIRKVRGRTRRRRRDALGRRRIRAPHELPARALALATAQHCLVRAIEIEQRKRGFRRWRDKISNHEGREGHRSARNQHEKCVMLCLPHRSVRHSTLDPCHGNMRARVGGVNTLTVASIASRVLSYRLRPAWRPVCARGCVTSSPKPGICS